MTFLSFLKMVFLFMEKMSMKQNSFSKNLKRNFEVNKSFVLEQISIFFRTKTSGKGLKTFLLEWWWHIEVMMKTNSRFFWRQNWWHQFKQDFLQSSLNAQLMVYAQFVILLNVYWCCLMYIYNQCITTHALL